MAPKEHSNPVDHRRGSAEGGPREDMVEVKCPDCGATVRIERVKAEREFKATCPKGHEVPLAKML